MLAPTGSFLSASVMRHNILELALWVVSSILLGVMMEIGRSMRSLMAVVASATAVALGGLGGTASASSAATPPFAECPAIGASPSCEILLVVNSDQSISVLGDSSVGPYDGSDDTLVGIVNNSHSPISAVTVSGPGSGLADFDGDGICTYASGGGNGTGFSGDSYCTSQQVGGSDPEDYAGPGTSFTLDPTSQDHVEVDFGVSGLAAGSSTYFSLEGALTAAVVTARKGRLSQANYVALGDSYSSGEGNPPFKQPNTGCDRSVNKAWPELVASMFGIKLEALLACSGATTNALDHTYLGQKPQLQALSELQAPKLVTITMGGNDLGFVNILTNCYLGFCSPSLAGLEGELAGGFGKHMTAVYKKIKAAAPSAHILVVGYPQIIPSNPLSTLLHCAWFKDPAEVLLMHSVAKQINSVLARAASAAGVSYVSTLNVLKGHELCTGQSWVNSVGPSGGNGRGHPSAQGQAMIAAAVEDYVVIHHVLPGL